jgi:uncharacterized protein YbcV (DUF1398 family)
LIFKTDLRKIFIQRQDTIISYESYKKLMSVTKNFNKNKVKAVYAKDFIKAFREEFMINE